MRIRSRRSWKAAKPKNTPTKLKPAREGVFIHHTVTYVTNGAKATKNQEKAHMRYLQGIAFARGFSDISYNFIVFPSGRVYRGRGWEFMGAHNDGENEETYGICFVGNFEHEIPTPAALKAAKKVKKRGKNLGRIKMKGFVKGHRDTDATACPGKYLYNRLDQIRG